MIKPPIPTFIAAYPAPKKTNWVLITVFVIVLIIGITLYFEFKKNENKKPKIVQPNKDGSCPTGYSRSGLGITGGMCM